MKLLFTNPFFSGQLSKSVLIFTGLVLQMISPLSSNLVSGPTNAYATGRLMVNFGQTSQGNVFNTTDFPGWTVIQKSSHIDYSSTGPGGLTMVSGTNRFDGWQSISGPAMEFSAGDAILVTWSNQTGGTILNWRPLISFEDQDQPADQEGDPQWYAMINSTGFFYNNSTVTTVYTITSEETAPGPATPTQGNQSIINICNNGKDGNQLIGLVLDKIEIVRAIDSTPDIPGNLAGAVNVDPPAFRVDLTWNAVDNAGGVLIDHYNIYRNGFWIDMASGPSYSDHILEANTQYTYSVQAVNQYRVKGEFSASFSVTTPSFTDPTESLLNPESIQYLGALRLPEDTQGGLGWMYRRGQMAYYPAGDSANVDGDEDFPGSLFATNHTYERYVAEISIPAPVITQNPNELPFAKTLQHFHQTQPPSDYDQWGSEYQFVGMTYLPANQRFYSTNYFMYNVAFTKRMTTFAYTSDFAANYGPWWVGDKTESNTPQYDAYAKYLGEIPQKWITENAPGHALLAGGERSGSGPDGPGLTAVKPWGENINDMVEPEGELDFIRLLEYKADGTITMNGWNESDLFDGVAWAEKGDRSAVILSGTKAYGEYYYGFEDGTYYGDTKDCVPFINVVGSVSKGPQARGYRAMLLFYNPGDLARVAKSQRGIYQTADPLFMEPFEPQPYASVDIDKYLFRENTDGPYSRDRIESMTYDRERGYLFITEPEVLPYSIDVIHVFKINGVDNAGPGLEDAINALQVVSGQMVSVTDKADANGDKVVDLKDSISVLKALSK